MTRKRPQARSRRQFVRIAAALACVPALAVPLSGRLSSASAAEKHRIGIIGAGRIGGTLGELWAKAGHEVLLSSRHPEQLRPLAERIGPLARVGTPAQAAGFGDVVLLSVPYGALPQVGRDFAAAMRAKVVLDACNPFPYRDGEIAHDARAKGAGLATAELVPGARLVRAFNSVGYASLRSEAHRPGERVAIPLAGDDADAVAVAARLVEDAGFEPVVIGTLADSRSFDVGSSVFGRALTARELRKQLGLR